MRIKLKYIIKLIGCIYFLRFKNKTTIETPIVIFNIKYNRSKTAYVVTEVVDAKVDDD